MFKWYEAAAICYAYLSDVGASGHRDWRSSRWFTRGWTLQELVAPFEVVLYDCTWKELGTKRRLATELKEVTRIPEKVLLDPEVRLDMSIAGRMSWAKGRKTTRPEDRAYCLLGIFAINVTLLYGEGALAFRRLHEELLRRIPDDTIFLGGLSWEDKEFNEWAMGQETTTPGQGFLVTPDNVPCGLEAEINPLSRPEEGSAELAPRSQYGQSWLREDTVTVSMRMIQVCFSRTKAALPPITMKQQTYVELDEGSQAAIEAFNTYGPKLPGSPVCLGLLRCGPTSDKLLARYFICREDDGELEAHPTSVYRYVSRLEASYWPTMQCRVFHRKEYFKPRPYLEHLRDIQSWDAEKPLDGAFSNGWEWRFINKVKNIPNDEKSGLNIWESESYELRYGTSIWGLTINLGPDKTVTDVAPPDFHVQIRLEPPRAAELYVETARVSLNRRLAQVIQFHRRVPVTGGSAELWITIQHGLKQGRHCYKPLIRFRGFEPSGP